MDQPRAALGDRTVGRVGYGAMQLGAVGPDRPGPSQESAVSLLRRVVELGVDHIDTADFYAGGEVNARIKAALSPYPDELVLVTKVGADHPGGGGLVAAQRPQELRTQVEDNLRSLAVDCVGVVNLRRLDRKPGILAEGDQLVALDDQLAELVRLREEGKIGAIGLSNVDADQLRASFSAGPVCVQNYYNVLDRDEEAMLDLCREHGVAWVPYAPLGSSLPGFRRVTDDPTVVDVAAKVDVTPGQVGLAWLLQHDPGTLLIPGTTSIAHLEENLAAADVRLDEEAMRRLDGVAAGAA